MRDQSDRSARRRKSGSCHQSPDRHIEGVQFAHLFHPPHGFSAMQAVQRASVAVWTQRYSAIRKPLVDVVGLAWAGCVAD